jgi:hypothetical protein
MSDWLKYISICILLLFLQVLLFDNLHWLGLVHPFIYIWAIILLPIELPRWAQMLIGATVGMVMDLFTHAPGIHMAGCVMIAYLRPLLVAGVVQDIDRLKGAVTSDTIGMGNWMRILAILVAVHHIIVFMLEAFTFAHFGYTLLQIILSGVFSYTLILMLEYVRKNA